MGHHNLLCNGAVEPQISHGAHADMCTKLKAPTRDTGTSELDNGAKEVGGLV